MVGLKIQQEKKRRNGKWKEFNKHAILVSEGHYLNDVKHGLWREYYETGELMIEEYYKNGIQHGPFTSYHHNGRILSRGHYYNGSREGYFKVYDDTGKNIRIILFINNIEIEDDQGAERLNEVLRKDRS